MKLPAYPKYKPRDIEWLGDIPAHWEIKRLRFVSRIQTGNTPPKANDENYSDEGLPWVKPDNLSEFIPITETKERLSLVGTSIARPIASISPLVCCIGTVGKFGYSTETVATNQQINAVVYNEAKVTRRFGLYVIAASEAEHIRRANINVVAILNTTQQSNISVPVPPLSEQCAITDFLDWETARLDTLVGKKRELIEKLKEKRTALISRTVTRGLPAEAAAKAGLNPNPKLKPSGIEWLGDIPKHWEIRRLRHLLRGRLTNGLFKTQEYFGSGCALLMSMTFTETTS